MRKWKLLLFIPALLLVAAANLRPVCTVRVDGVPVEGSWSPAASSVPGVSPWVWPRRSPAGARPCRTSR